MIFLDPMLPLGLIGPRLRAAPYVVVTHGAEITVPAGACPARVSSGGGCCAARRRSSPRADTRPRAGAQVAGRRVAGCDRSARRRRRALPPVRRRATRPRRARGSGSIPTVRSCSACRGSCPRKGFDVVIDAVRRLDGVQLAIAGRGRDRAPPRTARPGPARRALPRSRARRRSRGASTACADVFAMCCRERWGGLEAEGFGIVFLEAAACGVPAVAGRSGGAHEAVVDGETGFVVPPRDVARGARRDRRAVRATRCCGRGWAPRPGAVRATSSRTTGSSSGWLRSPAATSRSSEPVAVDLPA